MRQNPLRRNILLTDLGIAVIAAIFVLIITPGLAVAGMIALLVLIACAISLAVGSKRRGSAPPVRRRRQPPPQRRRPRQGR